MVQEALFQVEFGGTVEVYIVGRGKESLFGSLFWIMIEHVALICLLERRGGEEGGVGLLLLYFFCVSRKGYVCAWGGCMGIICKLGRGVIMCT
jgi:hypothetical protein